jgi:hypothetical protein
LNSNVGYSGIPQYRSILLQKFVKAECLHQHAECVRSPESSIGSS